MYVFCSDLISHLMSLPPGTGKTLSLVQFFTHSISNPALHCLVISRKNNNNNYVYHVDQSQERKEQMSRVWRSNSNPASFHLCHPLLTVTQQPAANTFPSTKKWHFCFLYNSLILINCWHCNQNTMLRTKVFGMKLKTFCIHLSHSDLT